MLEAPVHAHGADQALGLRRLFTPAGTRLAAVIAADGERPGPAALAVAQAANANGASCLVIDATHGEVASALGLAARYDLRHAVAGDRRLEDVVIGGPGPLRVLPAARGFADLVRPPHAARRIARLALDAGARDGWIVIAADATHATEVARLCAGSEVAVACRLGARGRTAAYALMKRLAAEADVAAFRLLVGGAPREAQSAPQLARVAQRFLGVPVAYGARVADARRLAASLPTWSCPRLAGGRS